MTTTESPVQLFLTASFCGILGNGAVLPVPNPCDPTSVYGRNNCSSCTGCNTCPCDPAKIRTILAQENIVVGPNTRTVEADLIADEFIFPPLDIVLPCSNSSYTLDFTTIGLEPGTEINGNLANIATGKFVPINGVIPFSVTLTADQLSGFLVFIDTTAQLDATTPFPISGSVTVGTPPELNVCVQLLPCVTGCNQINTYGSKNTRTTQLRPVVTGGTAPYRYIWELVDDNDRKCQSIRFNQTTGLTECLPTGTYKVCVVDANACCASATCTIVSHEKVLPLCVKLCATIEKDRGFIKAIATGGKVNKNGYKYEWYNVTDNYMVSNKECVKNLPLCAEYEVTVTDAHGNTASACHTFK